MGKTVLPTFPAEDMLLSSAFVVAWVLCKVGRIMEMIGSSCSWPHASSLYPEGSVCADYNAPDGVNRARRDVFHALFLCYYGDYKRITKLSPHRIGGIDAPLPGAVWGGVQGWEKEMALSWEKVSARLQPATAGHARLVLSKQLKQIYTSL